MAEVTILCPHCRKPNLRNEQNIRRATFCQHCGHDIVLNNNGPRYYITRVIKEGGQGAVYETIGEDWRTYAVKEMLDRFADPKERAEATERFRAEADLLQGLRHERVPRVYANFEDEGRHYLAMDFIRGEDLEQIVERQGALAERQVLEWADQICDVLEYLHGRGLIYRDMKPSNVMIDREHGGVKLIDFGIAKVFQRAERGTQIGTPGYAPPEQYQGLASVESDIYALGATLHHLLTGRDPRDEPPFSFPPVRTLKPEVSQRTADAVTRALQMKPEDRFQSVAEFRAALKPLPERPAQVRRAAPTVALPQQSAAARPATTATAQPSSVPAQPPVAPRPAPVPARAPQVQPARPGFFRRMLTFITRLIVTLLIIAVLGGIGLFFARPDLINQYAPGLIPQAAPTQPALTTRPIQLDLEVSVPAGSDEQVVRQAFQTKYADAIREKYGTSAQINTSSLSAVGGGPKLISSANGQDTYSASYQAYVSAP